MTPLVPVPLLSARGLRKDFGGIRAVNDVSFDLYPGELVALIGPNGAGKSTCFNLLNGQIRPDAGRVLLDGEDITGLPPRLAWRRGIGRGFQVAETFSSMTVRDAARMPLIARHHAVWRFFGPAGGLFNDDVDVLLAEVGLSALADRGCGVLAHGDRKRLDLALAIAHRPRLLLMDEPAAGMAAGDRGRLMDLVRRLARDRGCAVLFTEHDMDIVFHFADRILVMDRGELIAAGAPESVRADPRVRAAYLGSDP